VTEFNTPPGPYPSRDEGPTNTRLRRGQEEARRVPTLRSAHLSDEDPRSSPIRRERRNCTTSGRRDWRGRSGDLRARREQLGGIRDYWFCADCNNETRRWDEAFVAWTYAPLAALHDPRSRGSMFSARIIDADTGAFVRCLWAWMFAISDVPLRDRLPDVAAAVKSGDPVGPPDDPRLLLAVTRDDRIAIQALSNSVVVTAPPFVAMLLSRRALEVGGNDGFFDTAPWLLHAAGTRRTVEVTLPIVVPGPLPMIGEQVLG